MPFDGRCALAGAAEDTARSIGGGGGGQSHYFQRQGCLEDQIFALFCRPGAN